MEARRLPAPLFFIRIINRENLTHNSYLVIRNSSFVAHETEQGCSISDTLRFVCPHGINQLAFWHGVCPLEDGI